MIYSFLTIICRLWHFKTARQGKLKIINELVDLTDTRHLVFTDANVFFEPDAIAELSSHFLNEKIGQVGAMILNTELHKNGISIQEKNYIQRENNIKNLEGKKGCMQGAFGACYAIRASLFKLIPANFLMEDFYLSMWVLTQNYQAIFEPKAICLEDVSNEIEEEFKRKKRISAGNFQNLSVYWKLLLRLDFNAFCFFSHKVVRWVTPFLLLLIFISGFFLSFFSQYGIVIFLLQLFFYTIPLLDFLFKKANIHLPFLRLVNYFIWMNMALAAGFVLFLKGVKTSAWTPTKRT